MCEGSALARQVNVPLERILILLTPRYFWPNEDDDPNGPRNSFLRKIVLIISNQSAILPFNATMEADYELESRARPALPDR